MGVERIEAHQAVDAALRTLGLESTGLSLDAEAAIAELLRRTASFICPTTPGRLARSVTDLWSGLPGFSEAAINEVLPLIETLVAYGDLLELPVDNEQRTTRQLLLGPPGFVVLGASSVLLIGVRPNGAGILTDDLLGEVRHAGHARFVTIGAPEDVDGLVAEGLMQVRSDQWLRAPRQMPAEQFLSGYMNRLDAARPSGEVAGMLVIDPNARVTYYKGRWRELSSRDEGTYIARRPQAFGADLWCLARVVGGRAGRVVDLPVEDALAPGADEAWRLQAALDFLAGHPQQIRVDALADRSLLHIFSPVPSWARRRLDVVGKIGERGRGALFTYSVPNDRIGGEVRELKDTMWLSDSGGNDHDT